MDKLITSFLTKCQCWEPECGSRSLDKKDKKAQAGDADRFGNARSPSTVRGGGQRVFRACNARSHAAAPGAHNRMRRLHRPSGQQRGCLAGWRAVAGCAQLHLLWVSEVNAGTFSTDAAGAETGGRRHRLSTGGF